MLKMFFFEFFKSFRCVFIPQSCLQLIQNIFQNHLIFEKILKFLKFFFFFKYFFFKIISFSIQYFSFHFIWLQKFNFSSQKKIKKCQEIGNFLKFSNFCIIFTRACILELFWPKLEKQIFKNFEICGFFINFKINFEYVKKFKNA